MERKAIRRTALVFVIIRKVRSDRREVSAPSADDAEPPADLAAIAVLPFADMSPGRDQDYLCEGLADELINALTHVDGLRVAARTASFQFRGTGGNVREIGRQLGVGT